jgi:hypothetical protein
MLLAIQFVHAISGIRPKKAPPISVSAPFRAIASAQPLLRRESASQIVPRIPLRRLYVAVDDTARAGGVEAGGDTRCQFEKLIDWERCVDNALSERLPSSNSITLKQ